MYRRAVERGWGNLVESGRIGRVAIGRTIADCTAPERGERRATTAGQP